MNIPSARKDGLKGEGLTGGFESLAAFGRLGRWAIETGWRDEAGVTL